MRSLDIVFFHALCRGVTVIPFLLSSLLLLPAAGRSLDSLTTDGSSFGTRAAVITSGSVLQDRTGANNSSAPLPPSTIVMYPGPYSHTSYGGIVAFIFVMLLLSCLWRYRCLAPSRAELAQSLGTGVLPPAAPFHEPSASPQRSKRQDALDRYA